MVLAAVRTLRRESNGIPPTFQEVADLAGVAISTARDHVLRLQADGYVSLSPKIARSLIVTPKGHVALQKPAQAVNKPKSSKK